MAGTDMGDEHEIDSNATTVFLPRIRYGMFGYFLSSVYNWLRRFPVRLAGATFFYKARKSSSRDDGYERTHSAESRNTKEAAEEHCGMAAGAKTVECDGRSL